MNSFSLTVPRAWNYSPTDLMLEYSRKHKSVEFTRIKGKACLIIESKPYVYDHWQILIISERAEIATVYLKELEL